MGQCVLSNTEMIRRNKNINGQEAVIAGRGVLSLVGNTPLVELENFLVGERFRLYAKLEGFNPGGSMKDRPAVRMIEQGIRAGFINPGTVIIESSSGNMGIGLAQACSYYGLQFICVVDPKTTPQNIRLLQVYGAKIDFVVEPDPETGEFLKARIDRVKSLLGSIEDSFWPNQYANENNSDAHHQTMDEITSAMGRNVDFLFCAVSTCGTLRGCSDYIRKNKLNTKVIAVDAKGSVIFNSEKAKRLIPGHGAAMRPQLFRGDLASECIHVTDIDSVIGCRRLVRREAILAGGSSGAVLMAVHYYQDRIRYGSNCVAILPDRGERYLDTIYSDSWVTEHFGDISHFWQESDEDFASHTKQARSSASNSESYRIS
jgi:2,3-diaminopropionate biosynthesis protein SbnA